MRAVGWGLAVFFSRPCSLLFTMTVIITLLVGDHLVNQLEAPFRKGRCLFPSFCILTMEHGHWYTEGLKNTLWIYELTQTLVSSVREWPTIGSVTCCTISVQFPLISGKHSHSPEGGLLLWGAFVMQWSALPPESTQSFLYFLKMQHKYWSV